MMRIGSLFAGIGGLELGLERAGVGRTVWQVECEPFALAVLAKHWPQAERFTDVRTVGAHNLPAVDMLCGGFPCQDLSYAGKGAGLDGERSGLWREYARLVRELRPRFVVVENVSALLARGLGSVLGDLAACGYDAAWDCVPAAAVGAPHRRDRLFVVGWRRGCVADTNGQRGQVGGHPNAGHGPAQSLARESAGAGCAHNVAERYGCRPRAGARPAEPRLGRVADGIPAGLDRAFARAIAAVKAQPQRWPVGQWPTPRKEGFDAGCHRGVPDSLHAAVKLWPARPGEQQHAWEPPRTAAGVPNRAARLKALGNAVVPQVGEVAGRVVLEIAAALDAQAEAA